MALSVEELNCKSEGSIPDGVVGFCIYLIFLAALWPWVLGQPVAEVNTRAIPGGKGGQCQWRTQEFCLGVGVQQIQLRTERTGILGQ